MFGKTLCLAPLLAAALSAFPAATAATPAPPSDAKTWLQAVRAASGGDRWDRLGELDIEANIHQGGQDGHVHIVRDLRDGRHVRSSDLGVQRGSEGFDGKAGWMRDEKGLVTVLDAPGYLRGAITEAFIARYGWLRPDAAAFSTDLGARELDGRSYRVLRLTPKGGQPMELWIDARSHLPARLRQRRDNGQVAITFLSDYRNVDGVRLPFRIREREGDARYDAVLDVRRVRTLPAPRDADFRRPASRIADAAILGGKTVAEVPFERYAGLILVQVSIDGTPPRPFLLDTGGLNLLTPEAARELGIEGHGEQSVYGVGGGTQSLQEAQVGQVRLGDVALRDQRFLLVDLPSVLTDRGDKPPIAGLIGYELLRRFTTRLDYDRLTLTFSKAGGLAADDEALHLYFGDRTPRVPARVDGTAGLFMIDTGDAGELTVFGPFADAHSVRLHGRAGSARAGGVGGHIALRTGLLHRFELDGHALLELPASLSTARQGAFASRHLAGNLGQGVLSRFVLTFDYASRRLRVEPGARFAEPFPDTPSLGLGLDRIDHEHFRVAAVAPHSAAARAGLAAGARIVAIDGRPARELDLDELKTLLREGATHGLTVTVENDEGTHVVHVPAAGPPPA